MLPSGQISEVMKTYPRREHIFYYIGKFEELSYVIKSPPGRMHTMCQGKLLRSCTLAHEVYKSLLSEGFRELKWTCPLRYYLSEHGDLEN